MNEMCENQHFENLVKCFLQFFETLPKFLKDENRKDKKTKSNL
jgi:hypothetical protein